MTINKTSAVTVIGLGDMGGTLAATLLKKGFAITVWNRSTERAAPLVEAGAVLASSVQEAVDASPVIITCITNYENSHKLLRTNEVTAALSGKMYIELSTGTPKDARENAAWAREHDISYLDGAIIATPSQIGRPDTPIWLSGDSAVYEATEPILQALAGNLQFMGDDAGAAATWDFGFLFTLFGSMIGFFHGARVFDAEGIPVKDLGEMLSQVAPVWGGMIKYQGDAIASRNFSSTESTVDVCAATVDLFLRHAQEAGINSTVPDFMKVVFKKAQDQGLGKEQVAALFKSLQ